jgi:hypothetical protein
LLSILLKPILAKASAIVKWDMNFKLKEKNESWRSFNQRLDDFGAGFAADLVEHIHDDVVFSRSQGIEIQRQRKSFFRRFQRL